MSFPIDVFLKSFFSLFIVLDSFGLLPIFNYLMKGFNKKEKVLNANRATYLAAILLFVFLFFGAKILSLFGITISSFKIAGGIILLIIGLKIVLGLKMLEGHINKYSIAAVPIATPLLIGAGTITTIIILVNEFGYVIPFIASILNLIIVWIVIRNSDRILKIFGHQGTDIISKIMGIMLSAIAVEFIKQGFLGF